MSQICNHVVPQEHCGICKLTAFNIGYEEEIPKGHAIGVTIKINNINKTISQIKKKHAIKWQSGPYEGKNELIICYNEGREKGRMKGIDDGISEQQEAIKIKKKSIKGKFLKDYVSRKNISKNDETNISLEKLFDV